MATSIFEASGLKQTLVSGYAEKTTKQKKAFGFALDPSISDSRDSSTGLNDIETVIAGADADNATPLSLDVTTSIVATAGSATHVSLANGILGQVKIIIHNVRLSNADLVITPANFAAGDTITSDSAKRSVTLMYDGDNWQVIAGEITGTAEFVIG